MITANGLLPTGNLQCVIFDLDNTIVNLGDFVDWQGAKDSAYKCYLENGVSVDILDSAAGKKMDFLSNVQSELMKIHPPEKVVEIQDDVSRHICNFELKGAQNAIPMPGALDTLSWLKTEGFRMGIASSNCDPSVELALRSAGLSRFIEAIVGRNGRLMMKPNPEQVVVCLSKLNELPERSIMVGDTILDAMAAKAAGLIFAGVPTGRHSKEQLIEVGADHVISSLSNLPSLISKL
ncbi:MAG: HAD family hydrolase [Nitrososphaerales archaeon]